MDISTTTGVARSPCVRTALFAALAAAGLAGAGPAAADDSLTLEAALALAGRGTQPAVRALEAAGDAARTGARAEGQLPDPRLTFGVQNLPIDGVEAWRLGREDMTMLTVGVMQEVTTRGRRRAAAARMLGEADMLGAEARAVRAEVRRDVALAWLDVYEAQRRAAAYRELGGELAAEREVEAAKLAASSGSPADLLRLRVTEAATRDRGIVARRDERRARAQLARWIGDAALRPLPTDLPPSLEPRPDEVAPTAIALQHPSTESARRAVDVALREVDVARAERSPNWSWQLMYGARRADRSDMVTLQFAVDLPWQRGARQDVRLARSQRLADRAREALEDRERELAAESGAVTADLDGAIERRREYEEQLLPAARARLDTARAAYAGGRAPLAEVWEARRALREAELDATLIRVDGARAHVRRAWLTDPEGQTP